MEYPFRSKPTVFVCLFKTLDSEKIAQNIQQDVIKQGVFLSKLLHVPIR